MHRPPVVTAIVATAALCACSAPIKTVRIQSRETPVKGVRYTLLRPLYQLSLRVPDNAPHFEPLSKYPEIHIPRQDPRGNPVPLFGQVEALKAAGSTSVATTRERCVRGSKANSDRCKAAYQGACAFGSFEADVVLNEALKGEAVYEVRGAPWYRWPLHALSDTDISIVLDDKGRLSSLTAGETDKTLEFIQAVAGLAVKAAGAAATTSGATCTLVPVAPGFMGYVKKHAELRQQVADLEAGIANATTAMKGGDALKQKAAVESLTTLRTQLAEARSKEKAASHPLHPAVYRLEVKSGSGTQPPPLVLNRGLPHPVLTATLEGK